jgi:predicted nucleic acid-binding protein
LIVVSDASPLIILARVRQLNLLAEFYIRIPQEVHSEVVVAGRGLPGSDEVSRADWIGVLKQPRNGTGDAAGSEWDIRAEDRREAPETVDGV